MIKQEVLTGFFSYFDSSIQGVRRSKRKKRRKMKREKKKLLD
jgi:hypothetical protein